MIYAAIVGMWALVLVPMWLRRHDRAQESRSADRFARAMTTLRGSVPSAPSRDVLMPRRSAASRTAQVTVPHERPSTARSAAQRRRRTFLVLGVLLAGWVVLVALHHVPRWTVAIPVVVLVGFLVVARRQVALAGELRRRQARRATLADAARMASVHYADSGAAARRGGRAVEPGPQVAPQPVPLPAAVAAPLPAAVGDDHERWSAVPTTLPTYVTAPPATRVPRVIDLTTPGSWSGEAMVAQARETLAQEPVTDGGMRVESFEIAVPRDPAVRASVAEERAAAARVPASYAERYVDDDGSIDRLAEGEDDLDTLLDDPRTGVHGPTWRRAANG
jgi:hypothetical protein